MIRVDSKHSSSVNESRLLPIRLISFFGAGAVIVIALWAADARFGFVEVAQWKQSIRDWWHQDWFPEKDPRQAIPPQLPTPVAVTTAKELPAVLPGADSSISETPQALVLVSTTRGRNTREGTAQLGTHPENPQTYGAGALLANGARLVEIYDDHVVLERDGRTASLYLQRSGKKSTSDLFMVGGAPAQLAQLPPPTYIEILTNYIRPSPVYDGRQIKGYEVFAGQKSGVFSQLGLRNGDIILSLDHQPFRDPKQAIELFRQLTKGIAMVASVERGGNIEQISLDGALITADQDRVNNPQPLPTMPPGPGM